MLDIERTKAKSNLTATINEIVQKSGGSPRFIPEFLKLTFGPSRILFDEYIAMRLWDKKFCSRAALPKFRGNLLLGKICRTANFIPGAWGVISNKIASSAILETYGIASPPLLNLHASGIRPGPKRTATAEALEEFLLRKLTYPAFGKPLSGRQSLGSISLNACEASTGMLVCQDGRKIEAKAFAQEVHTHYAKNGYIFQPRLVPHDAVRAICGERTATVRIITISDSKGPRIFRACWKIPAGPNSADNFWRPGNLLGSINLDEGTVYRVISGTGMAMTEVEAHPDTKTRIVDTKVPLWEELCSTVLAGAFAFPEFGLLGWDIAATASGPVVVEVNETPDLVMLQIAERRGIMEPSFQKFLNERSEAEKIWQTEYKAAVKKEYTPSFFNAPKPK